MNFVPFLHYTVHNYIFMVSKNSRVDNWFSMFSLNHTKIL